MDSVSYSQINLLFGLIGMKTLLSWIMQTFVMDHGNLCHGSWKLLSWILETFVMDRSIEIS